MDMNSIQIIIVSHLSLTQMTIVLNINSLIKMVHGSTFIREDARRSVKFAIKDMNLITTENVSHVPQPQSSQIHFVLLTTLMDHVMFVHTDQSDNQTDPVS